MVGAGAEAVTPVPTKLNRNSVCLCLPSLITSVCSILAMAAAERLKTKQFDVTTAFLYGELTEEIFIRQQQGYEDGTDVGCKIFYWLGN